jgi:hypothetical protein
MTGKRAGKSRAATKAKRVSPKKSAPHTPHSAKALHQVIRELIEAKQRGDTAAEHSATAALGGFAKGKGPTHLQQAAAQAKLVAGNPSLDESRRLLRDIEARVGAA